MPSVDVERSTRSGHAAEAGRSRHRELHDKAVGSRRRDERTTSKRPATRQRPLAGWSPALHQPLQNQSQKQSQHQSQRQTSTRRRRRTCRRLTAAETARARPNATRLPLVPCRDLDWRRRPRARRVGLPERGDQPRQDIQTDETQNHSHDGLPDHGRPIPGGPHRWCPAATNRTATVAVWKKPEASSSRALSRWCRDHSSSQLREE